MSLFDFGVAGGIFALVLIVYWYIKTLRGDLDLAKRETRYAKDECRRYERYWNEEKAKSDAYKHAIDKMSHRGVTV